MESPELNLPPRKVSDLYNIVYQTFVTICGRLGEEGILGAGTEISTGYHGNTVTVSGRWAIREPSMRPVVAM